jgi:hypothetical protein
MKRSCDGAPRWRHPIPAAGASRTAATTSTRSDLLECLGQIPASADVERAVHVAEVPLDSLDRDEQLAGDPRFVRPATASSATRSSLGISSGPARQLADANALAPRPLGPRARPPMGWSAGSPRTRSLPPGRAVKVDRTHRIGRRQAAYALLDLHTPSTRLIAAGLLEAAAVQAGRSPRPRRPSDRRLTYPSIRRQ